jgi:hypothetical protein
MVVGSSRLQGPSIAVPIHDSPENASGYCDLGMEFTCVPHPKYPWSPEILKAIWEFDPGIVPIWINWSFQVPYDDATPSRVVTFGRHAVGRYRPVLTNNVPQIPRCEMPTMPCQGVRFAKPNILIRMFEGAPMENMPADLPGEFVPWDWSIKKRLRQLFIRDAVSSRELAKQTVGGIMDARRKRRAARQAEHEDRMRDIHKFVDKKLESLSDLEIEEHFQRRQHRTRASKPYVDLGDTSHVPAGSTGGPVITYYPPESSKR